MDFQDRLQDQGLSLAEQPHEPNAIAGQPFCDTALSHVEYLDRGQGRPVLVVHGSPGGHDQGSLMADFLVAAGLRAIIPSRPGYLGSELTDANRSIDGTVDAHAAQMATLGIDRFAVLCWSGGGPSGWRLAARYGDKVSALAALAAVSRRSPWRDASDERFMFGTTLGNWILKIMREHAPQALVSATRLRPGSLPRRQPTAAGSSFASRVRFPTILGGHRQCLHNAANSRAAATLRGYLAVGSVSVDQAVGGPPAAAPMQR